MNDKPADIPRLIGRHLLADLYGIDCQVLTNEALLVHVMREALGNAHFHIVDHLSHHFPGEQAGVTAVMLLAESHATFHSYPEHNYLAMDVFSCGSADPNDVLQAIVGALQPSHVHSSTERRGDQLRSYSTDSNGTSSADSTSSAARLP